MTFKPYLDQFVIVLMYCKKNKEKHDEHLAIVLREHKLYVKFEKLDLWVTKVQFLRHSHKGRHMHRGREGRDYNKIG